MVEFLLTVFRLWAIYESDIAIPSLYALILDIKILPSSAPDINILKSCTIFNLLIGEECNWIYVNDLLNLTISVNGHWYALILPREVPINIVPSSLTINIFVTLNGYVHNTPNYCVPLYL